MFKIVANPGRPALSSGGKYVAPIKGFRSGVNHTLIGHPPPPVVALTTEWFLTRI